MFTPRNMNNRNPLKQGKFPKSIKGYHVQTRDILAKPCLRTYSLMGSFDFISNSRRFTFTFIYGTFVEDTFQNKI